MVARVECCEDDSSEFHVESGVVFDAESGAAFGIEVSIEWIEARRATASASVSTAPFAIAAARDAI